MYSEICDLQKDFKHQVIRMKHDRHYKTKLKDIKDNKNNN